MAHVTINLNLAPHVALANTRYGPFFVLKSDDTVGRSLLTYGEWNEGEFHVLRQILRQQDCVVDILANVGSHTVALTKTIAPGGCVMAFEPHPRVFQLLCANTAINGLSNVRLYPAACAAEPGVLWFPELDYRQAMNYSAISVSGMRTSQHPIQLPKTNNGQPVPIVTLDNVYDLPALRLIKIDVEGMEIEVLNGAERTIRRHRPILYVENEIPKLSEPLLRTILDLDYVIYWHIVPLFNPDNFRRHPANIFSNIACVNNICVPKEANLTMEGFTKILDVTLHPRRK